MTRLGQSAAGLAGRRLKGGDSSPVTAALRRTEISPMDRQSSLHCSYTWHRNGEGRKSAIFASALSTVFGWPLLSLRDASTGCREAMKP